MNSLPSRTKALIGVSFREFARYALPSIIGMLIVGLQTIIDGLFVGRGVGALGLAAVNIAMPLISSMLSVSIMIISGGIVITGIAKGQGDEARAKGYTSLRLPLSPCWSPSRRYPCWSASSSNHCVISLAATMRCILLSDNTLASSVAASSSTASPTSRRPSPASTGNPTGCLSAASSVAW